jgi:hypothetical protein
MCRSDLLLSACAASTVSSGMGFVRGYGASGDVREVCGLLFFSGYGTVYTVFHEVT